MGLLFSCASFEITHGLAGQILALGAERGDEIASLHGYNDLGLTCTWTGEFRSAITALEHSVAIGERLLPSCPESMLGRVLFQLLNSRRHLSWTSWMLGYPEQALRHIDLLHALPQRRCTRFDLGAIMQGDLLTRCIFLRDYGGGRERAEALLALARENGFPYWEAAGLVHLGQAAVQEGASDEGIQAMLAGREMLRAGGEIFFLSVGQ